MQTQNQTSMMPVTTYQPMTVDAGGYVAQQYVQPGDVRYHLRRVPASEGINPMTGQPVYQRGGLGWVPYQAPSQSYTALQYQHNYQQVAVPQVGYVPQVSTVQVPVTSTKMQTEYVSQQVPVTTQRMQTEVVQQQVPVTTTRLQNEVVQQQIPITTTKYENQVIAQQIPVQVQKTIPVQEKVVVPHTTQKPVTRRVAKERVEYVPEQVVRPVTVQRETYKLEVMSEDIPVTSTRMERVVQKIQVPQRVARTVEVTEMRLLPRTVTRRIPLDVNGMVIELPPATSVESLLVPSESSIVDMPVGSPSDATGVSRSSKKPAVPTESGELPSPAPSKGTAKSAESAVKPSTSASKPSTAELNIGSPDGQSETEGKRTIVPIVPEESSAESVKAGKIRTSEED
jgi:hypothetical protein